jgi:hypothetical protein
MASFRSELVTGAKAEFARFGGKHETSAAVRPILLDYWVNGGGYSKPASNKAIDNLTAWSAAFVSYVVKGALKRSGSAATFKFSASHSVYAGEAIRNQLNGVKRPAFFGLPPTGVGAVKPEVGDIIGVTRVKWIDDYADALGAARNEDTYFSHFDIVVDVSAGKVQTIGGNVSNTVGGKTFTLTPGGILPNLPFKYSNAGNVISGPFICVIKHLT